MGKRRLVVHLDDIGGSHAANMAYADLWQRQAISAASAMVPCAGFPEILLMARGKFDDDIGIHLTLTSEFDTARWAPLTGRADNGLSDDEGFFPRTVAEVRKADPEVVEIEMRAQIETAMGAGLMVTHLDAHMMAMCQPEFIDIYERLGLDYDLPIVLARDSVERMGMTEAYAPLFARLEKRGNPIFEALIGSPLSVPNAGPDNYAALLDALPEGLSYGAFHCAAPGDIAQFAPDAVTRIAEHKLFSDGVFKKMLAERDIEMVGMRGLR